MDSKLQEISINIAQRSRRTDESDIPDDLIPPSMRADNHSGTDEDQAKEINQPSIPSGSSYGVKEIQSFLSNWDINKYIQYVDPKIIRGL